MSGPRRKVQIWATIHVVKEPPKLATPYLRKATFRKNLNANGLDVHNSLYMANGSFVGDVNLDGAKVGG
ncbi:MAG TPA: hypothetical protein VI320_25010, partial [Terracidiphilus sp.]